MPNRLRVRVRVRERGGWAPAHRLHDSRAWRIVVGIGVMLAVALALNAAMAAFGVVWTSRYDGVRQVGSAEAWRYVAELAVGMGVLWVPLVVVVLLLPAARVAASLVRGGFTLSPRGIRGAYARPFRLVPWSTVDHLRWEDRSRTRHGWVDLPGAGIDRAFQPVTLVAVLRGGGLLRVGARHLDGPARRAVERDLQAATEQGCCPVPVPGAAREGPGPGQPHVRVREHR